MARILIADDSRPIRKFLGEAISSHPGWEVCGEASNGFEAVSLAAECNPDVVVLDLTMPHLNGFQAAETIHIASLGIKLILFTQHECEPELEKQARKSGFSGWVSKGSHALLVAALEAVLRGETFFKASFTPAAESGADQKVESAEPISPIDPAQASS